MMLYVRRIRNLSQGSPFPFFGGTDDSKVCGGRIVGVLRSTPISQDLSVVRVIRALYRCVYVFICRLR